MNGWDEEVRVHPFEPLSTQHVYRMEGGGQHYGKN